MNISELIEELERIKKAHGDIPVLLRDGDWNRLYYISLKVRNEALEFSK